MHRHYLLLSVRHFHSAGGAWASLEQLRHWSTSAIQVLKPPYSIKCLYSTWNVSNQCNTGFLNYTIWLWEHLLWIFIEHLPVISMTFFWAHHMDLYVTFEGMNGEVNSKDKFCIYASFGFHRIIDTLQRLCLQLRCIIYRITLGTFLLLSLRDNDKYLIGILLPCHRTFHKNAMETEFGWRICTALQKLAGWIHAGHQKKDFLTKCKFMLINILQGSCYLFGLAECDTIWILWEIFACNIFRLYEAGLAAKVLKNGMNIQNYFEKL